jgi:hypothetical protein
MSLCAELGRKMGVSERGRAVHQPRSRFELGGNTYTVTVLTDLTLPSGFVVSNPVIGTNSAIDFLEFVITMIERRVRLTFRDLSIHSNFDAVLGRR